MMMMMMLRVGCRGKSTRRSSRRRDHGRHEKRAKAGAESAGICVSECPPRPCSRTARPVRGRGGRGVGMTKGANHTQIGRLPCPTHWASLRACRHNLRAAASRLCAPG